MEKIIYNLSYVIESQLTSSPSSPSLISSYASSFYASYRVDLETSHSIRYRMIATMLLNRQMLRPSSFSFSSFELNCEIRSGIRHLCQYGPYIIIIDIDIDNTHLWQLSRAHHKHVRLAPPTVASFCPLAALRFVEQVRCLTRRDQTPHVDYKKLKMCINYSRESISRKWLLTCQGAAHWRLFYMGNKKKMGDRQNNRIHIFRRDEGGWWRICFWHVEPTKWMWIFLAEKS